MNLLNCRENLWLEQLGDPIDDPKRVSFRLPRDRLRVSEKLPASAGVAWGRISVPLPAETRFSPRKLAARMRLK